MWLCIILKPGHTISKPNKKKKRRKILLFFGYLLLLRKKIYLFKGELPRLQDLYQYGK